jgi:hypothetical protein
MDKQSKKEKLEAYKRRSVIGGIYSILNTVTGKKMLSLTIDMRGSRNRFEFAQSMNSCVHHCLKKDWDMYGGQSFRFEELQTIEKKECQTEDQFYDDLRELYVMTAPGATMDKYE